MVDATQGVGSSIQQLSKTADVRKDETSRTEEEPRKERAAPQDTVEISAEAQARIRAEEAAAEQAAAQVRDKVAESGTETLGLGSDFD